MRKTVGSAFVLVILLLWVQPTFAASSPVTLQAITTNSANDQPQQVFHRGDSMFLSAALYNHLGGTYTDTVHPSVYNGRYRLLNTSEAIVINAGVGTLWVNYSVTIARTAPLGTYVYYFTLKQNGYADEVEHIAFTVVKP